MEKDYIGWPLPYPIVGAVAFVVGMCGLVLRWRANRGRDEPATGIGYALLAGLGMIGGVFYASMLGPWIVFFPTM